jgi:dipeptidyl-peptidase-4
MTRAIQESDNRPSATFPAFYKYLFSVRVPRASPLLFSVALILGFSSASSFAQDRLKIMPGYERYQKMSKEIPNAVKLGLLSVTWTNGGKAFDYEKDGKRYRYEIATRQTTELEHTRTNNPAQESERSRAERRRERRQRRERPERGRQFTSAISPDGRFKAFYRERNLWLSDTNGQNEIAITTDGSEKTRVKYGTASWVYGEELYQDTAMWWSTNSRKVAFYRFDESQVRDFYLQLDQTRVQSKMDIEPYPKAGATNPIVDLLIYDLETKEITRADVRDGKPFDDVTLGQYIYRVSWSRDSKELLFNRTNRRQNIMEFCAADAETGKCRVIVREEWLPTWVENSPRMRLLKDAKRFIWRSERTGWNNFYLYELGGKLLTRLTDHCFDVDEIKHVDEDAGLLFYTADSGDNPMKLQLHCVGLDGCSDQQLTDPAYHHGVDVAPDGKHFIDIAQTHDTPPVTRLMDAQGKALDILARSDTTKFRALGLKTVELLQFKAADGETDLYGLLHFPSNFKPYKKYPLLVSVYAGPETSGARETFALPSTLTELGFLVATFDSRSAGRWGKRSLDSIYLKLGTVELDDQAAGVKSLWDRRYVDRKRTGIYGTSYGGYTSLMCLLRYADVFHAACASSPPTSWHHYDTIYTERYMWIPQENKDGYDAGDATRLADKLKGRLMLYYGTADNNVHPNNSMQLIQALQRAGKSFEVQVGPDQGHGSINRDRMMEFFIQSLVWK